MTLPQQDMFQYEITIIPDVPPGFNRRIFNQLVKDYSDTIFKNMKPVYDGRRYIFMSKSLNFKEWSTKLSVTDQPQLNMTPQYSSMSKINGQERLFEISIVKRCQINMEGIIKFLQGHISHIPRDALNGLDVLLRHKPSMMYLIVHLNILLILRIQICFFFSFNTVGHSFYSPVDATSLGGGTGMINYAIDLLTCS